MYDLKIKNVKKGRSFYLPFLILGLFFFGILGFRIISDYIKLKSLDSTTIATKIVVSTHTDSDDGTTYSPTYYYTVDDVDYTCSSDTSSGIYPKTSNKKVYYNSKDPTICMTEYSKSNDIVFLLFLIIPIISIVVAITNMRKISKRIKVIKELNTKGKLVKNLPYHLEDTGMEKNNSPIKRIVVNYTLSSGETVTLYGDPRHDKKHSDSDGMVDLVIDENNPNNYFIDFEINRLTGNLPSDYYNDSNNIVKKTSPNPKKCKYCGSILSNSFFCTNCSKKVEK